MVGIIWGRTIGWESTSYACPPTMMNILKPLHFAVLRREVQSAENLLKHSKCDPNIQDLSGNTPLHMVLTGNVSLPNVQPLLNHNDINPSIQNREGNTPLHEAVMGVTPVDVVEALTLHKSCNPSKPNHEGKTPLQLSVDSHRRSTRSGRSGFGRTTF